MNLNERQNIILNILQQNPKMGKTAIMKTLFMLQQVKGIRLGYDFSIYTYGPFSNDIMEDIDELVDENYLSSSVYSYQDYIGYTLNITDHGKKIVSKPTDQEELALHDVLSFVRGKSAKSLELYSTIIYIHNLNSKNAWANDSVSIIDKVNEIKPHFSKNSIDAAYNDLKEMNYIH